MSDNQISNNITAIIEKQGTSQRAIARTAGIEEATLSRIVTGKTKAPDWETMLKIAEALDRPVNEVFNLPGVAAC